MPRRGQVRTGAAIVVDAAAAAAAPAPLAVGAVLLAVAWAAAPVVACASSSLQAGSCLGASVLSFQLRWPVAAPADPNPPPPLETVVVSPNASTRVRGSAPLARTNPFPLTESAARAWDRRYRSGRGAPCRGGGRGFRDGPTAAALAASSRAGSAAQRHGSAACSTARHICSMQRHCSADALPHAPPRHMQSCRSCLSGPSLSGAARNITKVQTRQHTNTQTRKQTPRWCRLPARVLCGAGHSWRR